MPPTPQSKKQLKALARVGGLGIEMALSTVIGLFAGRWVDGELGTRPFAMLFGLLLGVAAGFRSVYLTARRLKSELENDE